MRARILLVSAVVASGGCIEAPKTPSRSKSRPAAERSARASGVASGRDPAAAPEFVSAGRGPVESVVRRALEQADTPRRAVVVYVGASWCEPCQAFHRAVESGQLDDALRNVRFVEFDADRDAERLAVAGYDGDLIPRFALPGPDGRFGGQKIEGGIKGDGAVDHIMRRLKPMLAEAARR